MNLEGLPSSARYTVRSESPRLRLRHWSGRAELIGSPDHCDVLVLLLTVSSKMLCLQLIRCSRSERPSPGDFPVFLVN
eukprot:408034-Hanusia_phi.AAC.2